MHVSLKNPLLELALDLGSVSHDSLLCVGLTSNLHPGRYALSTHLRNFSGPIALWRASHAGQRKKYLLFFWRFAGALERGHGGRFLIRELPHVMVGPGGRPPTESKYDVTQSKLLERTQTSTKIYADGNKAWLGHCKVLKRKCYQVKHVKMQWTKKSSSRVVKTHGTQCLDRLWSSLKKYIPKELSCKHAGSRNLNQKVREYIYSFVWRHNVAKEKRLNQLGNLARKSEWVWNEATKSSVFFWMGEKNTHTYQCKCLKIVETQCKNQGISNMVKKEACAKCCEGCQNNDGGVAKRCEFCGAVRGAVTLFLEQIFGRFWENWLSPTDFSPTALAMGS